MWGVVIKPQAKIFQGVGKEKSWDVKYFGGLKYQLKEIAKRTKRPRKKMSKDLG